MMQAVVKVQRDGPRGWHWIARDKYEADPGAYVMVDRDDDGGHTLPALTVGKGPRGRWCVKRGKDRVSDLFDTEADAEAALAAMEC